jgi:hypothetical protein
MPLARAPEADTTGGHIWPQAARKTRATIFELLMDSGAGQQVFGNVGEKDAHFSEVSVMHV